MYRLRSEVLVYGFSMKCIAKGIIELKRQCSPCYRYAHKSLTIIIELQPGHVCTCIHPPPCLGTSSTRQEFDPTTVQKPKKQNKKSFDTIVIAYNDMHTYSVFSNVSYY